MSRQRALIFLSSIGGIFASMSPWINYPRIDLVLYGHMGDGWVTLGLFVIILIFTVAGKSARSLAKIPFWIIMFLSLLVVTIGAWKIGSFLSEKSNFETDDPFLITAAAGSNVAYGLYLLLLFGSINLLALFFLGKKNKSINEK
ncbi:MAG: hypothetical protein EA362_02865 [Saprospirales bacterium]|nr:MAG: hypothetical protein EA362_02865 [Saprospirales bacterium]